MLNYCRIRSFLFFFLAESSRTSVQLPPELCHIIMSPISVNILYTFSFVPSIMHRLEALLTAVNLKKMLLDHCLHNVPTTKVLSYILLIEKGIILPLKTFTNEKANSYVHLYVNSLLWLF